MKMKSIFTDKAFENVRGLNLILSLGSGETLLFFQKAKSREGTHFRYFYHTYIFIKIKKE